MYKRQALPEDLIFWVSYLGGEEATMAINFSRSASQIVGQYLSLIHISGSTKPRIS